MNKEKQARNWDKLLVHGYSMVLHKQDLTWESFSSLAKYCIILSISEYFLIFCTFLSLSQYNLNLSKGAHAEILLLSLLQHLDVGDDIDDDGDGDGDGAPVPEYWWCYWWALLILAFQHPLAN